MRAAEILRKLADVVDAAESGGEVDQLGRDSGSDGGIDTTRMTNAKAVENMKKGGTSRLDVISFGTTLADLYGNFEK